MVTTEHRKPLVAFLVVFAAACLVMGNGLRTQVVEVLIETGGSNELVTAIAPDMVLGQALDGAPQPQAAAKKVPAVQGPVQAGADTLAVTNSPSTTQSLANSSSVQSPAGADARTVDSRKATDRRAKARASRPSRPAARTASRKSAAPKSGARAPARAAARPAPAPKPAGARPAPAPAPRGAGKADRGPTHAPPPPRRVSSGDRAHAHAAPERRVKSRHATRQSQRSTRSNRAHSRPRHDSQRGNSHRGSGGHHKRGGHGHHGHRR